MRTRLTALSLVLVALSASAQQYDKPTSSLRKGVIPLVGSTAGANGAHFRTSLRIYAAPDAHGKIVFHPLGRVASDSDPSMPYSFAPNAGPNYRRNIGMRALSDVEITAVILRKNGKQEQSLTRIFPGDYSFMMPVEQFAEMMFTGPKATTPLTGEDGLQINAAPGHAITYYTYTDNRTNDPALVVSPADEVNVLLEKLPNP